MKRLAGSPRPLLAVLLATIVAGVGCDKKKDAPATGGGSGGAGSGSAAPVAPVITRPSQGALPKMPALELPDDPQRPAKIALGHALFFDTRLSVDGSRSCYSCHQNEHGNGGGDPIAIGAGDKKLTRHSPVIWNVAYFQNSFYWDGRSATLEAQAQAAWAGGNMGVGKEPGKLEAKATELGKVPEYAPMFAAAFPGQAASPDLVTAALAEYERTLLCADTAYDRFAAGDKAALDEAQQRGLDVFLGKGQCAVCHAPPFFSTAMGVDGGAYFNVGIGTGKPEAEVDVGRASVTKADADWAAFKPPSLRHVSKSAPYFHDGSVATLEEAVALMAKGGITNKARTPLLADRGLSSAELADLVAFLRGLDCAGTLTPPKSP
jgi:cytochrome c peroxidase